MYYLCLFNVCCKLIVIPVFVCDYNYLTHCIIHLLNLKTVSVYCDVFRHFGNYCVSLSPLDLNHFTLDLYFKILKEK